MSDHVTGKGGFGGTFETLTVVRNARGALQCPAKTVHADDRFAAYTESEGPAEHGQGLLSHVKRVPWRHFSGLGQLRSTAVVGNDLLSSCLYVSGICAAVAGPVSPIALGLVAVMLLLFGPIYCEVVTALPQNGGSYQALLNTTSKSIAAGVACLSLLSYVATAVVSAAAAVIYANSLFTVDVRLGTVVLLTAFAVVAGLGVGESASVAVVMFIMHVAVMALLAVWSLAWAGSVDGWATLAANVAAPFPDVRTAEGDTVALGSLGSALFFGFSSALLGVSGFETSANTIEEMRDSGVYVATVRNLWALVSAFNPLLALAVMAVLPVADVVANPADVLALAAGTVGGPALRVVVAADAVIVLAGAVLTAFVGVMGLVRRLALDGCAPPFLLAVNRMRGTPHWIVAGFWALCTSLFLALYRPGDAAALSTLGAVYSLAFLAVMLSFAAACLLLKAYRPQLPRRVVAYPAAVVAALIMVAAGLVGNLALGPTVVKWFAVYAAGIGGCVAAYMGRALLLRAAIVCLRRCGGDGAGSTSGSTRALALRVAHRAVEGRKLSAAHQGAGVIALPDSLERAWTVGHGQHAAAAAPVAMALPAAMLLGGSSDAAAISISCADNARVHAEEADLEDLAAHGLSLGDDFGANLTLAASAATAGSGSGCEALASVAASRERADSFRAMEQLQRLEEEAARSGTTGSNIRTGACSGRASPTDPQAMEAVAASSSASASSLLRVGRLRAPQPADAAAGHPATASASAGTFLAAAGTIEKGVAIVQSPSASPSPILAWHLSGCTSAAAVCLPPPIGGVVPRLSVPPETPVVGSGGGGGTTRRPLLPSAISGPDASGTAQLAAPPWLQPDAEDDAAGGAGGQTLSGTHGVGPRSPSERPAFHWHPASPAGALQLAQFASAASAKEPPPPRRPSGVCGCGGAVAAWRLWLLAALTRWWRGVVSQPIVFLAKHADLATLHAAAEYVAANEPSRRLVMVHVADDAAAVAALAVSFGTLGAAVTAGGHEGGGHEQQQQQPLEALLRQLPADPPAALRLRRNCAVVAAAFPRLRVDGLVLRGTAFAPPALTFVADRLRVPSSALLMGAPDLRFPFQLDQLGGARLVLQAAPRGARAREAAHLARLQSYAAWGEADPEG